MQSGHITANALEANSCQSQIFALHCCSHHHPCHTPIASTDHDDFHRCLRIPPLAHSLQCFPPQITPLPLSQHMLLTHCWNQQDSSYHPCSSPFFGSSENSHLSSFTLPSYPHPQAPLPPQKQGNCLRTSNRQRDQCQCQVPREAHIFLLIIDFLNPSNSIYNLPHLSTLDLPTDPSLQSQLHSC
jgi:hypothetical protein